MEAIQRIIKTNDLNYRLVRTVGTDPNRYAIVAPDGEFIDQGLNLSEGLETLYFIDPKAMH